MLKYWTLWRWRCCTLSSENLGMIKSLEKHVSDVCMQLFTWSKTKCFIVRFQTSSTWRKSTQIKPGCWVAHLFTIALMERSAMRLAGRFLSLRIIIALCWKGWLSRDLRKWLNYVDDGDLLTYRSEAVNSNGLFYWYHWNMKDSTRIYWSSGSHMFVQIKLMINLWADLMIINWAAIPVILLS